MPKTTTPYWNPLSEEATKHWEPVEGLEGMAEAVTLAFDQETGILYASQGGESPALYAIDPDTGAATPVGATGLGIAVMTGLDLRATGSLYASASAIAGVTTTEPGPKVVMIWLGRRSPKTGGCALPLLAAIDS